MTIGVVMLASGLDAAPRQDADAKSTATLEREVAELRRQVQELARERAAKDDAPVDLSVKELPALDAAADSNPLANPWYQNFNFWGFGAFGFLDTGEEGTKPDGGFLVKEATLFVEARAWEDIFFYSEIQVVPLGEDEDGLLRTGELYAHFRNLAHGDDYSIGLKVGRIDVPFGAEYLWQHSPDNPLISNSAAYLYGYDEGVAAYGKWASVGWVTSITDGTDEHSFEDDPAKAFTAKIYGSPVAALDLSASFLWNGDSAESAIEFGGSNIQPVGADNASTAGVSPSEKVNSALYELDAAWRIGSQGRIGASFGQARIDDDVNAFDRDITWFALEPRYDVTPTIYVVARWSEVGTYDSDEGYRFDGKIIADGNESFGYDVQRFRRLSVGAGWHMNPHTIVKVEVGQDHFGVIDGSPFGTDDSARQFLGLELVLSF